MAPEPQSGIVRGFQACPVCHGRGAMPAGFYSTSPVTLSAGTADEVCRTCHGDQIIPMSTDLERFREALRRIAEGDYPEPQTPRKIAMRALA